MEKGDKQKKKTGGGKVRTKLRVEVDVSFLIDYHFPIYLFKII